MRLYRFRRRRTKEHWNYIEAKNRMEANRLAAVVLSRIDFDLEGALELPKGAIKGCVCRTVEFWLAPTEGER